MRTSNFFNKGRDPNAVSISRITPPWFKGMRYEPLAPPLVLVQCYMSGAINETYFSQAYKKRVLQTLNPVELVKDVGMDAILLGIAPPGKFCHRRLVANWLEETLGIKVPECRESTWLWP